MLPAEALAAGPPALSPRRWHTTAARGQRPSAQTRSRRMRRRGAALAV
jgi:hypothetical protein